MPKFDTSLDSGALTTLAGLGALAYFTRDKKDGKDKKDKAAEALTEAAKPEDKKAEPAEPVKPEPAQPQSKAPISSKVATDRNVADGVKSPGSKPYPLNTPSNKKRPNKPYPVNQAAQTKAAMKGTADPFRKSDIARMDEGGNPYRSGGSVRSTASKRGDGIAKRGFTRA